MTNRRESSEDRLFELLRNHPTTTRTELVRLSGLSKATVSDTVSVMMARGLLAETGKSQAGRGRSQVVLRMQPDVRLVLGAQFTESGCHVVLADLLANPVAWADRAVAGTRPEDFVEALVDAVRELREKAPAPILGMGVGVPGLVSPSGRGVVVSVPYGWRDVPICDMVERELEMPVVAVNRAKAAALGEYWQGAHDHAERRNHLLYVHAGAGIIAGFLSDGQLYHGSGGAAGEIGHVTVQPEGLPCACGNRGCLYTLASESAIIRDVRSRMRRLRPDDTRSALPDIGTASLAELIEASHAGDPIVREVVATAGTWIGLAIANAINMINPSMVVIGGPISEFGDVLMDPVREEIRQRALWDSMQDVAILSSTLSENAGTIGAAALFLDALDVARVLAP